MKLTEGGRKKERKKRQKIQKEPRREEWGII